MEELNDFYRTAVMFIYPDGYIDRLEIDDDILHIKYYIKLSEISKRFANILKESKMGLTNKHGKVISYATFPLDEYFSSIGIIVIRNTNIIEVKRDNLLENGTPDFVFNIPPSPSEKQKQILDNMFNNYECGTSEFWYFNGEKTIDSTYHDIRELVKIEKKLGQ